MSDEQGAVAVDVEEVLPEAPTRGSADELLDAGAQDDLGPMRHSTAHIMAEAVLDLFPGTKLGIGPAIADGFYYDFALPRPLTPDDLSAIEQRMSASIAGVSRYCGASTAAVCVVAGVAPGVVKASTTGRTR